MASNEKVVPISRKRAKKRLKIEYVLEQYRLAHPDTDPGIEPHLIAPWAIQQGLIRPVPETPEEMLRKDIARYLKNEYINDPQGRHVRKNHAVPIQVNTAKGVKRSSKWYEKDVAPPDHMRLSLQLRRNAAFSDVKQIDLDFGSYNDNNVYDATLPEMDYDFNKDLADSKMPTTYPSEPSEGDDEI